MSYGHFYEKSTTWGLQSPSNENKMSDSGPERASLDMKVWKSSQSGAHTGPPFAPSHGQMVRVQCCETKS
jgi:hypothetical protein